MKKQAIPGHENQHQRSRTSRLTLHRETMRRLDAADLAGVAGGVRQADVSIGHSEGPCSDLPFL